MSSREYIKDCVTKVGQGKKLTLNEAQTTVLQGLVAGSVDTGRALALLKKDVFNYGTMRVSEDLSVPETVLPLCLDESMHVALRGILGMSGELADVMETVYLWFKGEKLDEEKLKIDLGDLTFYASLIINLIDSDWEDIQKLNKEKTDHLPNT